MFSDIKPLISSGKNLSKAIALIFLICFGLGLISYFWLDQVFALFFRQDENGNIWLMAREVTDVGLGQHYFIFVLLNLILLYYVIPRLNWRKIKPDRMAWYKAWTWNFLAALLCSGLFLRLFKYLIGRQRPYKSIDSNPENFQFFNHDWNFQSFPSGHTQVLFTVATMLCVLDPKRKFIWFMLAFGFSFTRVMTYSHFISDIIGGAFVGIVGSLIGLFLMDRFSRFQVFKK